MYIVQVHLNLGKKHLVLTTWMKNLRTKSYNVNVKFQLKFLLWLKLNLNFKLKYLIHRNLWVRYLNLGNPCNQENVTVLANSHNPWWWCNICHNFKFWTQEDLIEIPLFSLFPTIIKYWLLWTIKHHQKPGRVWDDKFSKTKCYWTDIFSSGLT